MGRDGSVAGWPQSKEAGVVILNEKGYRWFFFFFLEILSWHMCRIESAGLKLEWQQNGMWQSVVATLLER